jgi:hypothetical protein
LVARRGPPFTDAEKHDILDYCQSDVDGLTRLVPHLIPTIRSLPHAMLRAEYQWPMAKQERRGIPTNLSLVDRIRGHWDDLKLEIAREKDKFGLCEIVDGVVHMPEHRIQDFLKRNNMAWPLRETDGKPDLRDQTFRDMMGRYPEIGPIREMRATLSKFRLNELAIGADGRNRTPLWAYGTKTGRNAPSNSRYIFGPAKWVRFLISPPPGRVLVYRDFMQQEVRIAAVLSGDSALLEACESGDVYIGTATQLGFYHDGMSKAEHDATRVMFKVVLLGIQYGMGHRALALRTGRSLYEAAEILARLKARFRKFEDYATSVLDRGGLDLEISTPFGWTMQCPPHIQQRIIRNFPIQSTGAEILHVACILAERRGIEVVAPIHDAIMVEADAADAEDAKCALDRLMREASSIVLRGYELPSDFQIVHAGGSFYDKNGKDLWDTITGLVARLGARKVAHE